MHMPAKEFLLFPRISAIGNVFGSVPCSSCQKLAAWSEAARNTSRTRYGCRQHSNTTYSSLAASNSKLLISIWPSSRTGTDDAPYGGESPGHSREHCDSGLHCDRTCWHCNVNSLLSIAVRLAGRCCEFAGNNTHTSVNAR